jgi:hypothetical protein
MQSRNHRDREKRKKYLRIISLNKSRNYENLKIIKSHNNIIKLKQISEAPESLVWKPPAKVEELYATGANNSNCKIYEKRLFDK